MSKIFRNLLNLEGRVPSWISWVVCHRGSRGSEIFFREYFVGLIFFLVGILWVQLFFLVGILLVQKFLSWVFRGSKIFLVGTLWVQKFFSWVFLGYNFFSQANFVIQRFSVVGCVRKSDRKQKCINTSQTTYSIQNWFQQLSILFMLESYFIY